MMGDGGVMEPDVPTLHFDEATGITVSAGWANAIWHLHPWRNQGVRACQQHAEAEDAAGRDQIDLSRALTEGCPHGS